MTSPIISRVQVRDTDILIDNNNRLIDVDCAGNQYFKRLMEPYKLYNHPACAKNERSKIITHVFSSLRDNAPDLRILRCDFNGRITVLSNKVVSQRPKIGAIIRATYPLTANFFAPSVIEQPIIDLTEDDSEPTAPQNITGYRGGDIMVDADEAGYSAEEIAAAQQLNSMKYASEERYASCIFSSSSVGQSYTIATTNDLMSITESEISERESIKPDDTREHLTTQVSPPIYYSDSLSAVALSESFESESSVDDRVMNADNLTKAPVVNGDVKHPDMGRFPNLSSQNPDQPHEIYRGFSTIKVIRPKRTDAASVLEHYLNGTDADRLAFKSDRLVERLVTREDIDAIGGKNKPLEGQMGVFASRDIKEGELLIIYEGRMILTKADLACVAKNEPEELMVDHYGWSLAWEDQSVEHDIVPMVSAFSSTPDQHPVGDPASNINTALRIKKDRYVYDPSLINVVPEALQTNAGKSYGLDYDGIIYYASKRIPKGAQLFVQYGDAQLSNIFNNETTDREPHPYDYNASRNGDFPIRLFNPADSSISDLKMKGNQKLSVYAVLDHPDSNKVYKRIPSRSRVDKMGGPNASEINKNATRFLNMKKNDRQLTFDHRFKVESGQVITKKEIKAGSVLGVYSGTIYKKSEEQALADKLKVSVEALDDHAWHLRKADKPEDHYMISAQGTGNLLEMVSESQVVGLVKGHSSVAHQFMTMPDSFIFYARKNIPAGTNLTVV